MPREGTTVPNKTLHARDEGKIHIAYAFRCGLFLCLEVGEMGDDEIMLQQHIEERDVLQKRLYQLKVMRLRQGEQIEKRIAIIQDEIDYLDWQIGEISRSIKRREVGDSG